MDRIWKCADCGERFDEPDVRERREDMNGEGAWFTWIEFRCPECGSEDISEEIDDAEQD